MGTPLRPRRPARAAPRVLRADGPLHRQGVLRQHRHGAVAVGLPLRAGAVRGTAGAAGEHCAGGGGDGRRGVGAGVGEHVCAGWDGSGRTVSERHKGGREQRDVGDRGDQRPLGPELPGSAGQRQDHPRRRRPPHRGRPLDQRHRQGRSLAQHGHLRRLRGAEGGGGRGAGHAGARGQGRGDDEQADGEHEGECEQGRGERGVGEPEDPVEEGVRAGGAGCRVGVGSPC